MQQILEYKTLPSESLLNSFIDRIRAPTINKEMMRFNLKIKKKMTVSKKKNSDNSSESATESESENESKSYELPTYARSRRGGASQKSSTQPTTTNDGESVVKFKISKPTKTKVTGKYKRQALS